MVRLAICHEAPLKTIVIVRSISCLLWQRLSLANRYARQKHAYSDEKTSHITTLIWFSGRKLGILAQTANKFLFFVLTIELFCLPLHAQYDIITNNLYKIMKKSMTLVLATLMATLVFTGCISDKHIIYLQGADTVYGVPQEIAQAFELKIQSDDQLAISVTSKDHELIAPFNNNTLIGSGGGDRSAGYSSSTANTQSGVSYFTVDRNGEISFPIFGQLKVAGKTTREVSQMIQDMLRNGTKEYAASIKDAIITTKIMSFKVTVLGDVKNPGVQTFTGERLTLLEAIGRAGDLNSSGKRAPVLIVREENGQRQTFEVDLRDQASVFQSPAYYLQQNDVVYVSPNKSVRVKGSTAYTLLGVSSTLVSMIISITSLVFTLSRR